MFFFDTNYLIMVMLPALILSGLAQFFVRSAYARWGQERNARGLSGLQVAEQIIRYAGLKTRLEPSPGGMLSDHFDPSENVVRMSADVAGRPSVAAMAIAAHELGHAQQYAERSPLIVMRSFLVPAVQLSPTIAYGLIFAGLVFNLLELAWLGILFFGLVVIFMILTLPIEIDASMRGLRLLEQTGLMISAEDRTGARQVLTAAALTYIAAAVTAFLQLLYYISLISRSDRN